MSSARQEGAELDLGAGVNEEMLPKELADPTHPGGRGPGNSCLVLTVQEFRLPPRTGAQNSASDFGG